MEDLILVACHDCDLMFHIRPLPDGSVATCTRCGAVLHSHKRNSVERTLAWVITGLVLFMISNTFPLLALKSEGIYQEITLVGGVTELYAQGVWGLALLVFLTCILVPFLELTAMLYILLPVKLNRTPWKLHLALRFVQKIKPWGMMDVFMMGILVSIVKLAKLATIVPDIALYAFTALIFVPAAATASHDPHAIWEKAHGTRVPDRAKSIDDQLP